MNIPFSPPDISEFEINEIVSALKSGWITTGPKTKLFEQKIAQYCGTTRAVCLNSATAAMEMTLYLLGVGPGDEVITSAYTYTASASVIHHVGAKIVLVDTAPGSYEMDYAKLAEAITEKTKVIIPVDLGGVMCDYDRVFQAVESRKHLYRPNTAIQRLFDRVVVMADAAHSFGASYKGKRCGAVADFTCFSFHAVKNLTTAEGGAVTWLDRPGLNDAEVYQQYMLLSLHGQSKDALTKMKLGSWEYDVIYPAYKCNMTDLTAAFGLAQLSRFDALTNTRKAIHQQYHDNLGALCGACLHHEQEDRTGNYHLYMVRIPGIDEERRNSIIVKMAEAGVACNVHFKPLPLMTAYKNLGFDIKDYPNAYAQYRNEITLPSHTKLKEAEIGFVADNLKRIVRDGNGQQLVKEMELQFHRVWINDQASLQTVYSLIKETGEEMFVRDGLMHWATPLAMEVIQEECLTKEFYLVKEKATGRAVAVFNITKHPPEYYDLDKESLYLHRIAVVPELWRRGIGKHIFEWAKVRARKDGCQSIRSTVYSEDARAKGYLVSMGYQTLYQRKTKNFVIDCMEADLNG